MCERQSSIKILDVGHHLLNNFCRVSSVTLYYE